jgi:hypothetical protein
LPRLARDLEHLIDEVYATNSNYKLGGRMSDNFDATPGRTNQLLELVQKKLAGKVTAASCAPRKSPAWPAK